MLTKEFLSLTNLTKAQIFYIHKLAKDIIVCRDTKIMFRAFSIFPPDFEIINNC